MIDFLKKGVVALLIFCSSNTVFGQADSIDVFIYNQMQQRRIPRLQLAVVQNGKVIKTVNYGLANVQDSVVVSDQT
jgi:hypothetical protein